MSTQSEHTAAARTALETSGRLVFTYGEVEAITEIARPSNYIIFDVTRMFGGAESMDGTVASTMWRLGTLAVSSDEENANTLLDDCRTALEGVRLTVAGVESGPVRFETATVVAPDDGMFSGRTDWTYDHS